MLIRIFDSIFAEKPIDPCLEYFKRNFSPNNKDIKPEDKPYFENFYKLRKTYKTQKFGIFHCSVKHFQSNHIPDFINYYSKNVKTIPLCITETLQQLLWMFPQIIPSLNPEVITQLRIVEFIHIRKLINHALIHENSDFPPHPVLIQLVYLICSLPPEFIRNLIKYILEYDYVGSIGILGKFLQQALPTSLLNEIYARLIEYTKTEDTIIQSAACFSLTLFATTESADEKQKTEIMLLIEQQTQHEKAYPREIAILCQAKLRSSQDKAGIDDLCTSIEEFAWADIGRNHIAKLNLKEVKMREEQLKEFCMRHGLTTVKFTWDDYLLHPLSRVICDEFDPRITPKSINLVPALQTFLKNEAKLYDAQDREGDESKEDEKSKKMAKILNQASQKQDLSEIYKELKNNLSASEIMNILVRSSQVYWNEINVGLALCDLAVALNDVYTNERLIKISELLDPHLAKLPKIAGGPNAIVMSYRP